MEFQASTSTEHFFVERRWDGGRREGGQRRKMLMALGLLVGAAAFFAVGFFAAGTGNDPKRGSSKETMNKEVEEEVQSKQDDEYDYSWAMQGVNKSQIREYLKEISKEPHMAGLERDEKLASWIATEWEISGLDSVRLEGYRVLLDYPDPEKPNYVRLLDAEGGLVYQSHYKEEGVDDPNFVDAFNAYSRNGTASGLPVYVNFGRIEDFEYLRDNYGTEFTSDKICMARYGKIFRGNKAENAAVAGCSGLIIFMDPSTVAMQGTDEANVYPNTFWMPGTAVQRGSLALADGDPLTPNWPSLENAYRLDEDDRREYLPRIPVQPVGYTDVEQLLLRMEGDAAPEDWQGGLNLVYRLGGKLVDELNGGTVTIEVNNRQEERVSSNVIGVLLGSEEPDRYVMMGNHRDAWGFGALDPGSGTAQMMEVARVLGEKGRSGWRPKRSIVFLSWGAEEYSLCGSREFVEQYEIQLSERAVGYVNTDVCMSGPILIPAASPTLGGLYEEAVKDVQSPENDDESYFDYWSRWSGQDPGNFTVEFEPFVGAGSDHASFLFYAGVPVMDIMFVEDEKLYPGMSGYPGYHTGFETFDLVDRIYDPEFKVFRACAQLNLRLSLQLAESPLLPLKMEPYAKVMEEGVEFLEATGVLSQVRELGITTTHWEEAVLAFRRVAEQFDSYAMEIADKRPELLRLINDQMRGFERNFLLAEGLPDRIQYRHVIVAPSMFDAYGGSAFPGVGDILYNINEQDPGSAEHTRLVKVLRKHVSDLMILIGRASQHLNLLAAL